jgi:hypothetical protein
MITQISYNVLIERLRAFAEGHYLIKGFTHGHPSNIDIEKGLTFPWMHVYPVEVEPRQGSRLYSFIITFADLPRDKETPAEYEREVISDCIKLAEDLLAEIQNGLTLFGPTVELEGSPSIEVFIQEYSQTLTGVNLALTMSVPWDWSACDIPADWSVGGSGSGGTGSGGTGVILETNGVLNVDQTLLNLQQGENITIVDNGSGTITISGTGGGGGSGTVTSVALTTPNAFNVSGSPITGAGTLAISAAGTSVQYIDGSGNLQTFPSIPAAQVNSDWNAVSGLAEILNKPTIPTELRDLTDVDISSPAQNDTLLFNAASNEFVNGQLGAVAYSNDYNDLNNLPSTSGTVTSVALTMPTAFTVAGSPITTAGTLAVTGAGTTSQYIRGDGTLANFPSTGGGGGQIFYCNGNVSQGTIGGNAFYQLGTAANTGPAANFTRNTTGVIARFITDVNSPNHLVIPAGVWTVDAYLSETGGGSNNAEIIAVLKVYNGSTFTTIASSPLEQITNGIVPDLYTFAISVPNTVTAATDRVVIEFDIQNTNGKTVTLYTENNKIGEVHSTYAIGLSSLNGLTANTQTFATGTTGTDFGISSVGSVHTFNLPTASAANRGALSSADWSTFDGKQNSIGLTTVGTNLATLPNPSAISFLRVNADNTVTARTPAQVVTDLGIASSIILGRDFTGVSVVNTTTNTIAFSAEIPANTLQANDFIEFITQLNTNTPNGTSTIYRVYVNTSLSLTGATQIATFNNTVGTGNTGFQRNIYITAIGASGNLRISPTGNNNNTSYVNSSVNASNITINTTASIFIILAIQMGNATSTASTAGTIVRLTR